MGEKTYKTKCTMCHGPDGKGQTPGGKATKARDLRSGEAKSEADEQWAEIIHKGKNKMPPYGKKLSDAEIKAWLPTCAECAWNNALSGCQHS